MNLREERCPEVLLDLQKCSMIPLWTRASNFKKGLLNAFSQLCKEIVFNPSVDRITCNTSELLVNTQECIKHAFLWTLSRRLRYIVSSIFFGWFKTLMEFLENLLQPSTFLSLQHLRNKLKTKVIFWFDSKISTKCIWKYVFSYPNIVGCFFPSSSFASCTIRMKPWDYQSHPPSPFCYGREWFHQTMSGR